jgi:hypothetical protein
LLTPQSVTDDATPRRRNAVDNVRTREFRSIVCYGESSTGTEFNL